MTSRHLIPDTARDELSAPVAAAAAELAGPLPDHRAVVGWLSTHIAALEHAIHPAARRAGLDIAGDAAVTRRVEHLLLQLHALMSGDGRATAVDVTHAEDRLRALLTEHLASLDVLLDQLRAALPVDGWTRLLAQHRNALRNAPTRPHPHTPHGPVGERLTFRVAGAVDRLLDALDSRTVPPIPVQRDGSDGWLSATQRSA